MCFVALVRSAVFAETRLGRCACHWGREDDGIVLRVPLALADDRVRAASRCEQEQARCDPVRTSGVTDARSLRAPPAYHARPIWSRRQPMYTTPHDASVLAGDEHGQYGIIALSGAEAMSAADALSSRSARRRLRRTQRPSINSRGGRQWRKNAEKAAREGGLARKCV